MPDFLDPIPWFTLGPWELGPFTIYSFGVLVAVGVLVAHWLATRRAGRLGRSPDVIRSMALWALLAGFVGAHLFDILVYHPGDLIDDPLVLFDINGGLSSYGGALGGLVGLGLWHLKNREVPLRPYLDIIAFVVPIGWFFGRLGCFTVHDHPGVLTGSPFGVAFPDGVRHDLGLYEAVWWSVIIAVFFAVDRLKGAWLARRPGFYLGLLAVMYAPVRFGLDFLRVPEAMGGDARYLGLTPAQYVSLAVFAAGLAWLARWRRLPRVEPERREGDEGEAVTTGEATATP